MRTCPLTEDICLIVPQRSHGPEPQYKTPKIIYVIVAYVHAVIIHRFIGV